MPIKVETEVQKLGAQEEVVEELMGLSKLTWEFTTFRDNLRELNTSLKVSSTHIDNALDLNTELSEEEENLEKTLKKEISGLSDHPAYELYKSAKTKHKILVRIIMHYNLQNKVLVDSINALESLLIKAHEYGAVRQKVENELEILRDTRTTLKETVAHCLNMLDTQQKNYFISLGNFDKRITDLVMKVNGVKLDDSGDKEKISSYFTKEDMPLIISKVVKEISDRNNDSQKTNKNNEKQVVDEHKENESSEKSLSLSQIGQQGSN